MQSRKPWKPIPKILHAISERKIQSLSVEIALDRMALESYLSLQC